MQTEFNFLPYNLMMRENDFISPYVTAGMGAAIMPGLESPLVLTVPFGLGLKVRVTQRLGLGGEWSFRKTFTDQIDGIENILISGAKHSNIHNNDWYSFAGLNITYNISKIRIECPAYD